MNPNRYKQLKKLINAGYPLYLAIALFLIAVGFASKVAMGLLDGAAIEVEGIVMLVVLLAITLGLGWVLWKIGMDAKTREDSGE